MKAGTRVAPHYEIEPIWQSAELPKLEQHFTFSDVKLQPGSTYRVRARVGDTTGRWSHWSMPFEFIRKLQGEGQN
jgi:hypothetical protein